MKPPLPSGSLDPGQSEMGREPLRSEVWVVRGNRQKKRVAKGSQECQGGCSQLPQGPWRGDDGISESELHTPCPLQLPALRVWLQPGLGEFGSGSLAGTPDGGTRPLTLSLSSSRSVLRSCFPGWRTRCPCEVGGMVAWEQGDAGAQAALTDVSAVPQTSRSWSGSKAATT